MLFVNGSATPRIMLQAISAISRNFKD